MRKIALSSAVLLVLTSPAGSQSSPAAPANYSWTGAYVGGTVAYSEGRARSSLLDPLSDSANSIFGSYYGGLHAGYNYLLRSGVLVGIEADVSFPNFLEGDDVVATRSTVPGIMVEKIDFVSTVRGRLGYAFGHWLAYGTAGLAWSSARVVESPGAVTDSDLQKHLRTGWTIGAGAEVAIAPAWTARLEYRFDHLDRMSATFASGTSYQSTIDDHSVRLGLSRYFGNFGDGTEAGKNMGASAATSPNWNIHGQFTYVQQGYPSFRSPYEGQNSLQGQHQANNTISTTAFVGWRPWAGTEVYVNPELMQGFGLSDVHGVGGFPNGEAQKSNFPAPRFNVARLFARQTFGLGGEQETIEDGPNQIAGKQDISRLTFTFGKLAVTDIFNGNIYANDPRTTFLNWNMYGGGSYDWTMDKLSYTWGGIVDLNQKYWALRLGYFLLPVVSNDNMFDTHIPERGEYSAELELRYSLLSQPGKLRLFGWLHRGTMGSYTDALAMPASTANFPDITLTRRVRGNYGYVANVEQALTKDLGIFSRLTWSPGQNEIMGWTDVDQSLSLGAVLKGTSWGRPNDKVGIGALIEGLSPEARSYFAAGGLGILIGDGRLNYRPERILEAYYTYSINKWMTSTFDYQLIDNPGFNTDRGPISLFSARLHAEF